MQTEKSRKLHQLIRKDQANAKSERIKALCFCSTCLITTLNLTSIALLQITNRNSSNDQNSKEFFKDYQILSKGSGVYLSTFIQLICLTKYSYQSIMFRITRDEHYSRRKLLLLTVANNLTACVQSVYIVIILLRSQKYTNAKKYNTGIFESSIVSTKIALAFTFISTFYSIIVAGMLWRKLLLNDEKIAMIHRDRHSINADSHTRDSIQRDSIQSNQLR